MKKKIKSALKKIISIKDKLKDYNSNLENDKNIKLIKLSGLFDILWYLEQNLDVKASNMDPVKHYFFFGSKEGRNPNPYFDTNFYLISYSDVRESGENPLVHYLKNGAIENRITHPNATIRDFLERHRYEKYGVTPLNQLLWLKPQHNAGNEPQNVVMKNDIVQNSLSSSSNPPLLPLYDQQNEFKVDLNSFIPYRVIYISGLANTPSHNYRVKDHLKALNECQIQSAWIDYNEVKNFYHQLSFAEVIVLFRLPYTDEIKNIIDICKKAGVLIVYDTDDFVFDPKVANEKFVDGIRFLTEDDKKLYHKGVLQYKEALEKSDVGIFTTKRLAEAATEMQIKSFIIKNGYSEELYRNSSIALKNKSQRNKIVSLGYASGTLTHQKDFKIISSIIAQILAKYVNVKLVIVGMLDLKEFPELQCVLSQIECKPLVPHSELPYELINFDINLVPLEINNPFCEAKSELKYFEAGLLKIPTIASATEPYKRAITNGENGYVAVNENDWFNYLIELIKDNTRRQEIGENAYTHSMANYGPDAKRNEVLATFSKLFRLRRENLLKNSTLNQTITFLVPPMDKGSGGHAVIIDMAKWMAHWGHTVTLAFTGGSYDYPSADKIENDFDFDKSKIRATISNDLPTDTNIAFATFWKTVYSIEKSAKVIGRKYYFLQDYEPYFYPMSSDYILALNTYYKKINKISIGYWIKNMLSVRHNIHDTRVFPFFFNKKIYSTQTSVKRSNKKIIYFARPHMPRRCFDLGIQVLEKFRHMYGETTEIIMFGSQALNNMHIPFKYTNLGILTPNELADLYRSGTLGIAFSPTNPSKAPYEMMACGLPVLDLDIEGNEVNYGSKENVFLTEPDIDIIANTIHEILNNNNRRNEVALKGQKFVEGFPDEEESAKIIYNYLLEDSKKID